MRRRREAGDWCRECVSEIARVGQEGVVVRCVVCDAWSAECLTCVLFAETYPDGTTVEGEFKDGKLHGQGKGGRTL